MEARNCPHDSPTVVHSTLNTTFHGIPHPVSNQVHHLEQFRGIKYASIPQRFRRSKLVTEYPEHYDATKYGPIAPQAKFRNVEQSFYGMHPGQYPLESFPQSEFECLNLNITAPAYLDSNSRLPVMVWVHGGGNVGGNGSRWLLDGGHLVRRSMEVGKPIVFVAINYRLGLFGFAASQEIKLDNASAGDKGVGNYGLHDQLNALRWIHRYISEFGGDSSKITVCGQGKGAVDVHSLLLAGLGHESHLVYRAILQSGTCPPPSTYPTAGQQGVELMRVCNALGIPVGEGALENLRTVSADELVKVCTKSRVRISPTNDGVFFRPSLDFSNPIPPSPSIGPSSGSGVHSLMGVGGMDPPDHLGLGIDAILIGDTYTEATPYMPVASHWTPNALSKRIRAVLRSPWKADAVLRAFEVGDFGSDDDDEHRWGSGEQEYCERVGELIADCLVGYGIERLANRLAVGKALAVRKQAKHPHTELQPDNSTRTKVFRYLFDQPSPFNSTAHHTVDLVYLFGNIDFEKACSEPYSINNTPSGSGSSEEGFGFGEAKAGVENAERQIINNTITPGTSSPAPEPSTSKENPFTQWDVHSGYQMPHLSVWGTGSTDGWYEEKRVMDGMQVKWIDFICGEEPWGEYWPVLPKGWGEPEEIPEVKEEGASILATPDPSPQLTSKLLSHHTSDSKGTPWDAKKELNPKTLRAIEILEHAVEESGICGTDGFLRPPISKKHGKGDGENDCKVESEKHKEKESVHHHTLPKDPAKLHHDHHEETYSDTFSALLSSKLEASPLSRHSSLSAHSDASFQRQQNLRKKRLESHQGKVYIFGPAGDTYAAPVGHLVQHRRLDQWREAFEDCPLSLSTKSEVTSGGVSLGGSAYGASGDQEEVDETELGMESPGFRMGPSALEEKEIARIGMELANGPPEYGRR